MNLKVKATVAFLSLVLIVSLAYAVSYLWSQQLTVTVVAGSISINRSPSGDILQNTNVVFTGQVLKGSTPIASCNITLYRNSTPITWTLTNSTGHYTITWNATSTGTFTFQTRAEIP